MLKDRVILQREAKAIGAELEWYKGPITIVIRVFAPYPSLWASTHEPILTYECPHNQSRDAVPELLGLMSKGFVKEQHANSCECDLCETLDNEVSELDF